MIASLYWLFLVLLEGSVPGFSRSVALTMHRGSACPGYRGMIRTHLVSVLNCKPDATSENPHIALDIFKRSHNPFI